MVSSFAVRTIESTIRTLREGAVAAIPRVIAALVVVAIAYVLIRTVLAGVRRVLERMVTDRQALVVDLAVSLVGVFLWFSVALAVLKIVGMGDVAASLGTAIGFIALGVSYALSEMIEDTVAGVYLLRDPDFEVGDRVAFDGVEGRVAAIELRKSRVRLDDGDTAVVANRSVESRWTRRGEPGG